MVEVFAVIWTVRLLNQGLTKTLSLVRFSFISTFTPIAAKYSSRNIRMKSFEVSETKTKCNRLVRSWLNGKSCMSQVGSTFLLVNALLFSIVPSAHGQLPCGRSKTFLFQVTKR